MGGTRKRKNKALEIFEYFVQEFHQGETPKISTNTGFKGTLRGESDVWVSLKRTTKTSSKTKSDIEEGFKPLPDEDLQENGLAQNMPILLAEIFGEDREALKRWLEVNSVNGFIAGKKLAEILSAETKELETLFSKEGKQFMRDNKPEKKEKKVFYLGYGVSLKAYERPRLSPQFDHAIRTLSEEFHRAIHQAGKQPGQHAYPGF